ncbi:hypothetical protein T492DRAFT_1070108 [Pavlovales sp. CCMP2436]|nr:hypothetical protein T492DRAFT_1070108 [Pavlovales sp. CCMP2436]
MRVSSRVAHSPSRSPSSAPTAARSASPAASRPVQSTSLSTHSSSGRTALLARPAHSRAPRTPAAPSRLVASSCARVASSPPEGKVATRAKVSGRSTKARVSSHGPTSARHVLTTSESGDVPISTSDRSSAHGWIALPGSTARVERARRGRFGA